MILTQVQVKEELNGENVAQLRKKLLKIEVMKPFMTYDLIELIDGTSKETLQRVIATTSGNEDNGSAIERISNHPVYDTSLRPLTLRNNPSSKTSLVHQNVISK